MGVMAIYHDAFPVEQRVADAALARLVPRAVDTTGGWNFQVAEVPPGPRIAGSGARPTDSVRIPDVVGFAVGLHVSPIRLAYIAYLAARNDWRGRGVGTALFRSLVDTWMEGKSRPPRWIFLEVERPELARNENERALRLRRIRFYERLGCRRIDSDFQAPPLGPKLPVVPYWILVLPLAGADFSPRSLRAAILDIYHEVYGLDETHALVVHALKSMSG
jgi:ribosomal protein S18 acetylase RimI-like enzyme